MEKKTFDMRGKTINIARLASFDSEGFIHMVFYRLLIFYSIIYGIIVFLSFLYLEVAVYLKLATIILWVLFTPQVYETAKGFSLIGTKGIAFGHLSREHLYVMKHRYKKGMSVFPTVTALAFMLWLIGFIVMLIWWNA